MAQCNELLRLNIQLYCTLYEIQIYETSNSLNCQDLGHTFQLVAGGQEFEKNWPCS